MKSEIAKMIEEKRRFIVAIETMLAEDQLNNQVDCLAYVVKFHGEEFYDEYIDVIYLNGYTKRILTTANSNGANLKAVVKEVYK